MSLICPLTPVLSPNGSASGSRTGTNLSPFCPFGDKSIPCLIICPHGPILSSALHDRGQMSESRMESGLTIIQYIRIGPNGLVLSPHSHFVPSDLSPHSHFVPRPYTTGDRCPEAAWHRAPAALWEVRGKEGCRGSSPGGTKGYALKSQHPWASGTKSLFCPRSGRYILPLYFLLPP